MKTKKNSESKNFRAQKLQSLETSELKKFQKH